MPHLTQNRMLNFLHQNGNFEASEIDVERFSCIAPLRFLGFLAELLLLSYVPHSGCLKSLCPVLKRLTNVESLLFPEYCLYLQVTKQHTWNTIYSLFSLPMQPKCTGCIPKWSPLESEKVTSVRLQPRGPSALWAPLKEGEGVEQVAKRGCGWSIPVGVQG